MKRFIKFSSVLLSGKAISAALGLASFAIVGRGLSMTEFGVLMLIVTYKQVVNRILNFQTWHAIIKFGSPLLSEPHSSEFRRLLGFCLRLDAGTALLAAIVGIGSAYALSGHIGWIEENRTWIAIYCIALVTNYRGFTTGIFRLFDEYNLQTAILIMASVFKLIGAIILSLNGADFIHYFALWMTTDILVNLAELILSQRVLRKHGLQDWLRGSIAATDRKGPGIWSFVLNSNLDGFVRILRDTDTLLIATLINVESAAIYTVAKRFSTIINMVGDTAFEVIYPESAKLLAAGNGDAYRRSNFYSSMIVGIPSLLITLMFYLYGEYIIGSIMGENFTSAAMITTILLAGVTIYAFSHPMIAIQLTIGQIKNVVRSNLISTIIYIALLMIVYNAHGLPGVALAFLISQVMWLMLMISSTRGLVKNI